MTTPDYEAQYLALCARHQELRRVCKDACHTGLMGWYCVTKDGGPCVPCQGRGWLPLPAPERLDALVAVAGYCIFEPHPDGESWFVTLDEQDGEFKFHAAPKPWQALVAALSAEE